MSTELYDAVWRDAVLSVDGLYRYSLTRRWDGDLTSVTWVMLNPSSADAYIDDPTIRRCIAFTRRWGYGGLHVVNLFAFRASKPKALCAADDPFGPDNTRHIVAAVGLSSLVVVGWGAWYGTHAIDLPARVDIPAIAEKVGVRVGCLGTTAAGAPRHPLYVRGDQPLQPWPGGDSV